MAKADDSKLDYLGRGVDCRKPKDTWLDKLDSYGGRKIRDLAPNDGNINRNTVKKNKIKLGNENKENQKGVEGSLNVTPHRVLKLGGELKVKRDSSKTTKYEEERCSTRTVTLRDDTTQDPDIIKRDGTDPPIHYTKYEEELCQFILKCIDTKQIEASTKGREEATCLGKMIKNLQGGDAVAKLEEYLQHARSKKELYQPACQTLANACCSFITKKLYTHYVKSITLGAIKQESYESQDSNHDTSGGAHVKGVDIVDGSVKGGQQAIGKSNVTSKLARGKYDSDSGTVTGEEVIEASMESVSSLINERSQELKIIMERLIQCYICADQGVLLGPFHVSCRTPLSLGREHKIYWQVIGDEIYGTTTTSEASTFYIQCKEEQFCSIIHKTSELQTEHFATVQRPFLTECPLKLVPNPEHQDVCFTLMNKTKQPVKVPQTEAEWKTGSPFYIKLPKIGIGYFKPMRYISVRRIIEKEKKKIKPSDADSKVEVSKHTPASGATLAFESGEQKIESRDSGTDEESKHTTVSGVIPDTPPPPKSEEVKETKEMQKRESIIEKLKYTTGSSATPDTDDKYVITMQFHFELVVNVQGSQVTISSGPPPRPSRIESDSALGGDEVIRQRQEEEDDIKLKQDFIELVGQEYVFPLPVTAVDIPDTQQ